MALTAPRTAVSQQPATPSAELSIRLVGNAGVLLSDDATSLLVDLPYESGAFGYATYDPAGLEPVGQAISVITHHHRDHFALELFRPHAGWRLMGPPTVTAALPESLVVAGDSIRAGAFSVIAIPTPHTDDHRSYRIRWRGRVLHFTGDTTDPSSILAGPPIDLLFVTPWLACSLADARRSWDRAVLYHGNTNGSDRDCGMAETHPQGAELRVGPSQGK